MLEKFKAIKIVPYIENNKEKTGYYVLTIVCEESITNFPLISKERVKNEVAAALDSNA